MRAWQLAKWRLLARLDDFPDFELYHRLVEQEGWDRQQLDSLRRAKTKRLLQTCLSHIPYYGDLMRRAGLSPESIRGPEDLEVLPLLDKAIIGANRDRMLNSAALPSSYHPHTTGGSTGTPLDFHRGWAYAKHGIAANMRAFRRMGWRPGDTLVKLWAPHDHEETPRGVIRRSRRRVRQWLGAHEIVLNAYATSAEEMEAWLDLLRRRRPRFIYGYASNLALFANFLAEKGVRLPIIRGIASTATALFPSERRRLRQVFPEATIIDLYGSREIPGIAAECAHGAMHINQDLVHVEFLPVANEPGRQRLVVTALDNTIFPFIRYDIGDSGKPSSRRCACGLAFPCLEWGYGKILDSFITPEGGAMAGGFFEDLMYGVTGVHAYQFRQKTVEHILLYVVPSPSYGESTAAHIARVREQIRTTFSPRAQLRLETVEAIPPTPAGKHQFVVSEVRHPQLASAAASEEVDMAAATRGAA